VHWVHVPFWELVVLFCLNNVLVGILDRIWAKIKKWIKTEA